MSKSGQQSPEIHLVDFILAQIGALEPAQGLLGTHPGPETSKNSKYVFRVIQTGSTFGT